MSREIQIYGLDFKWVHMFYSFYKKKIIIRTSKENFPIYKYKR